MFSFKKICKISMFALMSLFLFKDAYASEIDLNIPSLDTIFNILGLTISGSQILFAGMIVCVLGMIFGLYEFVRIKKMPSHISMKKVSETIYETCKTYMKQQAKL